MARLGMKTRRDLLVIHVEPQVKKNYLEDKHDLNFFRVRGANNELVSFSKFKRKNL